MLLRYRFRVYPTAPQRALLARAFGCARVIYNDAVGARKRAYAQDLPYPTIAILSKTLITEAKRTPERAWLAEVSSVVLQQALADADRAYKNFFASGEGGRAREWGPEIQATLEHAIDPVHSQRPVRCARQRTAQTAEDR